MFYDYDHNGFLLTIFILNIVSLISILLITLFYIYGNGHKYFIQKLYFCQVIILLIFFLPQTIGPFFYSEKLTDCYDNDNDNDIQGNWPCDQQYVSEGYCKFQGITKNSGWFANALFSFLSCRIIQGIIGQQRQIEKQIGKYIFIIVSLIIICNIGSCFAKFTYYGVIYGNKTIYYICNLELVQNSPWVLWWVFQLIINAMVLIFGFLQYCHLQKSIQQLETRLQENFKSIKTLKLQSLQLVVILFWTFNIIIKLCEKYLANLEFKPLQIILFLFMLPVQLLGLVYAEFYFYSFQDHLKYNLPPCLKIILNILVHINLVTLYFSKQSKYRNFDMKSLIISNEASLIYDHDDEISTN